MKFLSVLDTSVTSYNIGNDIIMDAIWTVLEEMYPDSFCYKLPWEGTFSRTALKCMQSSDLIFFGGANVLTSRMLKYKQMGFRLIDLLKMNRLILFGVGWWQYQTQPDLYTRVFLNALLEKNILHCVRDGYTLSMLSSIGVSNVLNTSCPTTWTLTKDHCDSISSSKSENVIFTVTDYNQHFDGDQSVLTMLSNHYKKIFFWAQGAGDLSYFKSFTFDSNKVHIIPPKLKDYDSLLQNEDCDYIGTRLHAGIRALQKKKRATILAVDNRAIEISKDIMLNVVPRTDLKSIETFILSPYKTTLTIPLESIGSWKRQFLAI
jgi:polysaccharide pyruvyl transferase WcaK-like protein